MAYGSTLRTTQREAHDLAAIRDGSPSSTQLQTHDRRAFVGRLSPRSRMTLSEGTPGALGFPRPTPTGAGGQNWRSLGLQALLDRQTSFSILKFCLSKTIAENFFPGASPSARSARGGPVGNGSRSARFSHSLTKG